MRPTKMDGQGDGTQDLKGDGTEMPGNGKGDRERITATGVHSFLLPRGALTETAHCV
jgi:hypothetical protein